MCTVYELSFLMWSTQVSSNGDNTFLFSHFYDDILTFQKMMQYSRLIFILTLLNTVVTNIHGLLNTCVPHNVRRSRAKSVALSLRSGAAYTDERLVQNMLKHTQDVKEQITRRVQHWMAIERAQKELFLDGEDENMNGHAAIQRAQAQAEQLSRSVEMMSKEGNDELSLDDRSLRIIEDLMVSIEWYRDYGVACSVEVPLKRNQGSFINRVLLRKNPDNNHKSFSQTPTISLNCRVFKHKSEDSVSPRRTVVVLTGWGESHVKYSALMYRLYSNGFNVLTYDHRCQGMSSRSMRRDNPQVTDIHRFDDYVDDFLYVYDQVICPELLTGNSSKISLVAHSMGCLVSLKAQMRRKGNLIDKAALVCPMFEPQTPFPARFTVSIILKGIHYFILPIFLSHLLGR